MRRILLATLTSLTLGLTVTVGAPARAQTAGATEATAPTASVHHRHRRSHHRAMSRHAGRAAHGLNPGTTGSVGTGTSASDTTGAQTSLSNAVHNQTPAATR